MRRVCLQEMPKAPYLERLATIVKTHALRNVNLKITSMS